MSVEIKTDRTAWANAIQQASDLAVYALAEQILTDSEKYVPYSGGSIQSAGNLRESGFVERGESGEYYVIWDAVYALYQWFGMRRDGSHRVQRYTTPGTGKQWVEKARQSCQKRWDTIAQKAFSKGLT